MASSSLPALHLLALELAVCMRLLYCQKAYPATSWGSLHVHSTVAKRTSCSVALIAVDRCPFIDIRTCSVFTADHPTSIRPLEWSNYKYEFHQKCMRFKPAHLVELHCIVRSAGERAVELKVQVHQKVDEVQANAPHSTISTRSITVDVGL